MAYVKTVWVDDAAPAINAANLNKIEQGIYDAHSMLGARPKRTYGLFADGPPAAPTTGDLWIATLDSEGGFDSDGVSWTFRYNGASASPYKWEFDGGSTRDLHSSGGNIVGDQVWHGILTWTVERSGEYRSAAALGGTVGGAAANLGVGLKVNGGDPPFGTYVLSTWPANYTFFAAARRRTYTVAAGQTVQLAYWGNAAASLMGWGFDVLPLRVS